MENERKISYSEAEKLDRDFVPRIVGQGRNITLTIPSNYDQRVIGDFVAESKYSRVRSVVITDENGKPDHDRLVYKWAPCVIVVTWGIDDETGNVLVGVLSQKQSVPDEPGFSAQTNGIDFEQLVMGFLNKNEDGTFEDPIAGGVREFSEESGTPLNEENFSRIIRSIYRPAIPRINYAAAAMEGWTDIVFVEVDPHLVGQAEINTDDEIRQFEMITTDQLELDIREGLTTKGYTRDGGTLSTLFIWWMNKDFLVEESKIRRGFKEK